VVAYKPEFTDSILCNLYFGELMFGKNIASITGEHSPPVRVAFDFCPFHKIAQLL